MDETHLGERARLGARMPIVDGIEGHVIPSAAFQIRRGRQRVACDACILHGGPPDEGGSQCSSVLFSARQCSSVLVSAHQCSSGLISTHLPLRSAISAHQCSSVLIRAHQGSSARTSPCARQCRVGSAAAQTRTPSGRCRGRGDGRGAREHIEELQSSATQSSARQSSARQSSAIKRNQARSHLPRARRWPWRTGYAREAIRSAERRSAVPFDEPRSRTIHSPDTARRSSA
jgi:hypothetical protein